jgi:cell shape-determining protein MreC
MELENHITKQTYIQLLTEILKRKSEILKPLLVLTKAQEAVIAAEPFSEEEFLKIISAKEEQIRELSKLDAGFEQVYESVKEELSTGKEKYRNEITGLKELILTITDQSVELQTLENRNRSKLELLLSAQRKAIKQARISARTATDYYKTMVKQHEAQSFFYDKKN